MAWFQGLGWQFIAHFDHNRGLPTAVLSLSGWFPRSNSTPTDFAAALM